MQGNATGFAPGRGPVDDTRPHGLRALEGQTVVDDDGRRLRPVATGTGLVAPVAECTPACAEPAKVPDTLRA